MIKGQSSLHQGIDSLDIKLKSVLAKIHGGRRQAPKTRGCPERASVVLLDHDTKLRHAILVDQFLANEAHLDATMIDRGASIEKRNLGSLESDCERTRQEGHERSFGEADKPTGWSTAGIACTDRIALDDRLQASEFCESDDRLLYPEISLLGGQTCGEIFQANFDEDFVKIFIQLDCADCACVDAAINERSFAGLNPGDLVKDDFNFRTHRLVVGPEEPAGGQCSDEWKNQNPGNASFTRVTYDAVVVLLLMIGHVELGIGCCQIM